MELSAAAAADQCSVKAQGMMLEPAWPEPTTPDCSGTTAGEAQPQLEPPWL